MLFSQRIGYKNIKNEIQEKSIDDDLRNSIWSALCLHYIDTLEGIGYLQIHQNYKMLFTLMWLNFFKKPIDTLIVDTRELASFLREKFFKMKWYEIYDLIEFIANNFEDEYTNERFTQHCNILLEKELSAYRFVSNQIIKITSENEINEVDEAAASPYKQLNTHISVALTYLNDRKNPDYRNSIKESISAVESMCKIVAGGNNATLGDALKKIEREGKVDIHPCLKQGFEKLYAYTNDSKTGIRHALIDEDNISFEEAKFMLVSCSAFINFLKGRLSKSN